LLLFLRELTAAELSRVDSRVRKVFSKFDRDGSRSLSVRELHAALRVLGLQSEAKGGKYAHAAQVTDEEHGIIIGSRSRMNSSSISLSVRELHTALRALGLQSEAKGGKYAHAAQVTDT